jgi:alpha-tubulin suppressor-like RCC1 family protein
VTGTLSPAAPGRTITLHAFSYDSAPLSTMTTKLSTHSRYAFSYPSTSTEVGSLYITVGKSRHHSASADYLSVHVTAVITSLSAGHGHACVATSTRETFCWGDGTDGDIGYSGLPDSFGPYPTSNLPPARAVAAGLDFSCGLLVTRRIDCWGGNDVGQLGDNGVDPTAAGDVERVVGITNAIAITAGEYGACALLATGSVSCWGSGDSNEFGNGHTQNSPVPVTVPGVTNATAITAGFAHICALLKTGSVKCWGANQDGQLGRGTFTPSGGPAVVDGLTTVKAISAGYDHTCALLVSGAVKCWGDNDYGQLGTDQPNEHGSPVGVPGIVSAISIGAGGYHTCAVVKSGRVRCWGQGDLGELGNGHKDTGQTPVTVRTLTDAKTVISGYDYSCSVLGGKSDAGDAWCWGNDEDGQDGDVGGHTDRDVPIKVPF